MPTTAWFLISALVSLALCENFAQLDKRSITQPDKSQLAAYSFNRYWLRIAVGLLITAAICVVGSLFLLVFASESSKGLTGFVTAALGLGVDVEAAIVYLQWRSTSAARRQCTTE